MGDLLPQEIWSQEIMAIHVLPNGMAKWKFGAHPPWHPRIGELFLAPIVKCYLD